MAGGDALDRKSPWTSLEIARLVLGAATPLALFGLGYVVTQQTSAREEQAKAAAAKREDELKKEATDREAAAALRSEAREIAAELAAIQRNKLIRDEAFARERALVAEGYAREKALRDEAYGRDTRAHQEGLERARYEKLFEKRDEFWDKLNPKLSRIDSMIVRLIKHEAATAADVEETLRECDDLFGLYRPYFSPRFVGVYVRYKNSVRMAIRRAAGPGGTDVMYVDHVTHDMRTDYASLRDLAAMEVAAAIGLLEDAHATKARGADATQPPPKGGKREP